MCEKNEFLQFQLLVIKFALFLFCYKGHKFFYKGILASYLMDIMEVMDLKC